MEEEDPDLILGVFLGVGHLADGGEGLVEPGVAGGLQLGEGGVQLVGQVLLLALRLHQGQLGLGQLQLQLSHLHSEKTSCNCTGRYSCFVRESSEAG